MNLTKKLAATFLAVVAFVTISQAQAVGVSETATATATIVAPITLNATTNLQFGNIAVTSTGGTVTIDAAVGDGIGGRSKTGGLTFPALAGTITRASFDVTGESNYTYDITLPADGDVTLTHTVDNTKTMAVNGFHTEVTTPKLAVGVQTFHVGATLTVANAQATGEYTGQFTVSVNYN